MLGAFLCLLSYRRATWVIKVASVIRSLFARCHASWNIFLKESSGRKRGIFFMCAGNLFGLRFIQTNKRSCLILFSLALAVTAAYKMAFLIGFCPFFSSSLSANMPLIVKQ